MITLLDLYFKYLTPITFGGAVLFDLAIIGFIIIAVDVFTADHGNNGNKEGTR